MGGGGGGGSGPTVQQQQLETMQAQQNADLNLEENNQRKTILNAMQGTRVFRGSALSRALAGNTDGAVAASPTSGPASKAQNTTASAPPVGNSILDAGRGIQPGGTLGPKDAELQSEAAARAQSTIAAAMSGARA